MSESARVTDANEIIEALAGMSAWDNPVITTRQEKVIRVRRIRSFNQSSRQFLVISEDDDGMFIHLDDISQVERSI